MSSISAPEDRVPIVEEEARISKRLVPSGHVRVRTVTDIRDEVLSESLERSGLSVERRAVEREVPSAPPPRGEDGATVISLVEERLVLKRALFVIEEVVIRHTTTTEQIEVPVSLRSTRAVVEQDPSHQHQKED